MIEAGPIRLMLVDDHLLFRAGLKQMLLTQPGIEVVAEAASVEEAFLLLQDCLPQVILLDLGLPGMGGIAALAVLRVRVPTVRLLVLSMHRDQEYVARALEAGASGYLLKETCSIEELCLAVGAVVRGHMFISSRITELLVGPFVTSVDVPHELTGRQRQVVTLLTQGLATKEVAAKLGVSAKTVDSHRAVVMERLGLRSMAQLVLYAVRSGLISAKDGMPLPDAERGAIDVESPP